MKSSPHDFTHAYVITLFENDGISVQINQWLIAFKKFFDVDINDYLHTQTTEITERGSDT